MLRRKSELLSTAESSANSGNKTKKHNSARPARKQQKKKKLAHNCPQARRAERQKELGISQARRQRQEDRFYLDYRIVG